MLSILILLSLVLHPTDSAVPQVMGLLRKTKTSLSSWNSLINGRQTLTHFLRIKFLLETGQHCWVFLGLFSQILLRILPSRLSERLHLSLLRKLERVRLKKTKEYPSGSVPGKVREVWLYLIEEPSEFRGIHF